MRKQELIDEILDNFDFYRVWNVMNLIEWKWTTSDGVPHQSEIRRSARRLLSDAYICDIEHKRNSIISSGGLEASALFEDGTVEGLQLKFVLAECDTF